MLRFDEKVTRLLDNAYQGADVTRRRRATFDALEPTPGDRILDIGCGTGLLTLELARAVGDKGYILGIDPSQDMRNPALERCAGFSNVEVMEGAANQLPVEAETFDKALSLQVFEYLDDIPGAVAEINRVLREDGRIVIGDIHWDSLIWFSENKSRMAKMITAWDRHLVERRVPEILPGILMQNGFKIDAVQPVTICDTLLKPDGLANMLMHLMQPYAVQNGIMAPDEAQAWAAEQAELADRGCFFFSITHYVVTARKV